MGLEQMAQAAMHDNVPTTMYRRTEQKKRMVHVNSQAGGFNEDKGVGSDERSLIVRNPDDTEWDRTPSVKPGAGVGS